MSIAAKINHILSMATGPVSVVDLYRQITACQHSIRARLHYATRKGTVCRVGKALYIGSGSQAGMQADSRAAVAELAAAGAKFDMVLIDLPYESEGTVGGNRHFSRFPTITPLEFDSIMSGVASMLRTETSPVVFIFSNGRSSAKAKTAYQAAMDRHLSLAASGEYQKTDKAGKPVQIMGRRIPAESVHVYTRSGRMELDDIDLNISAIRPPVLKSWCTEKPVSLLRRIIRKLRVKGLALDPFAGSGSTSEACELCGLGSLSIDLVHNPIAYRQSRAS